MILMVGIVLSALGSFVYPPCAVFALIGMLSIHWFGIWDA